MEPKPPTPSTPTNPATPENAQPLACLRCGHDMEIGFAADGRHRGAFAQSIWCEGEPEKSIWVGIKTRQTQAGLLVTTFRCPACGYLESYAPPPETPIQL